MSSGHVKDLGFLGGRAPPEIESMSRSLKDVDQDLFRKLLKAVVSALEGKDCREAMRSIAETTVIPQERLSHIIAGMHRVLSEATRIPAALLKQEAFKEDLRELRIPEDFITDFCSVVFGSRRAALEKASLQKDPHLPTVDEFKWRVDVAISTSSLARALQPSVLMQMKLSDGKLHRFETIPFSPWDYDSLTLVKAASASYAFKLNVDSGTSELPYSGWTFRRDNTIRLLPFGRLAAITSAVQVPVSKFHELRYNVALILKEMNDLEKRSVLKIQD